MSQESHRQVLQQQTLVLNRSWLPIGTTTVRRAVGLLVGGDARVVAPRTYELYGFWGWVDRGSRSQRVIRTPGLEIPAPEIIVLGEYDRVPSRKVPFSRNNLFRRDKQRCQYCGRGLSGADFSIDHVIPRSRGGGTSWENCVLACVRCNLKKGDRLLRQTGMKLRSRPKRPEWSPCLGLQLSDRHLSWRHFIGERLWNIGLIVEERPGAIA